MGSQRHNGQHRHRTGSASHSRSDEPNKKFTFGSKGTGQSHSEDRRRNSNADAHADPESAGDGSTAFTPQQQKVIFEHLLITKSTAPQKNYSHVPCKFFRQGSCQAGTSCPFSHSLDASAADQTPCEYFKRGNCKFGSKCANAHILADGVRVNPGRQFKARAQPHHDAAILENSAYQTKELAAGGPGEDVLQTDAEDECEEFYIPTDFADLLTPEELKRRNSRSSSSSIASSSMASSLKRPELLHSHSRSLSSSSFGSEPLFSSSVGNVPSYRQRTFSNASLSSSASSTTTSPLLHQQLSYFQHPQSIPVSHNYSYCNSGKSDTTYSTPKTQQSTKVNYSPWSPMLNDNHVTKNTISWLGSDLTKMKIDEEAAAEYSTANASLTSFDHSPNIFRQDTQFFFDDIPVSFDQA